MKDWRRAGSTATPDSAYTTEFSYSAAASVRTRLSVPTNLIRVSCKLAEAISGATSQPASTSLGVIMRGATVHGMTNRHHQVRWLKRWARRKLVSLFWFMGNRTQPIPVPTNTDACRRCSDGLASTHAHNINSAEEIELFDASRGADAAKRESQRQFIEPTTTLVHGASLDPGAAKRATEIFYYGAEIAYSNGRPARRNIRQMS